MVLSEKNLQLTWTLPHCFRLEVRWNEHPVSRRVAPYVPLCRHCAVWKWKSLRSLYHLPVWMRGELFKDRTVFEGNRTFGFVCIPAAWGLNFRGLSHLKWKKFSGGGPPDPHPRPSTTPKEGGWKATAYKHFVFYRSFTSGSQGVSLECSLIFFLLSFSASYFMTYHDTCVTSDDYVQALRHARMVADNITKTIGVEVFPYRLVELKNNFSFVLCIGEK